MALLPLEGQHAQAARISPHAITCDYEYRCSEPPHTAEYLTPGVIGCCRDLGARRILDLGCGNGAMCAALSAAGFDVIGCDPGKDGIALARASYPQIEFHVLGAYDDPEMLGIGGFDAVVSTEVIEHLFLPRLLPRFASRVLRPEGHLVLSTPYHGYVKNLALSLAGKWDAHFSPSWDGGHVKFWSRDTLTRLLAEEDFAFTRFIGAGRLPYLWKSMIVVFQKK